MHIKKLHIIFRKFLHDKFGLHWWKYTHAGFDRGCRLCPASQFQMAQWFDGKVDHWWWSDTYTWAKDEMNPNHE